MEIEIKYNGCKSCKFSRENSDVEAIEAKNYCSETLGCDGYYQKHLKAENPSALARG